MVKTLKSEYEYDNFIEILKGLSTPSSFEKGERYFEDFKVGKIKKKGNFYKSKVKGAVKYHVTMELNEGNPVFVCDCPYDYSGICKHAVALALAVLNDENIIEEVEKTEKTEFKAQRSFMDHFSKTKDSRKLQFLEQLLEKNSVLQNQFHIFSEEKNISLDDISGEKIDKIKEQIYEELSNLDFDEFMENYYENAEDYHYGYFDEESYIDDSNVLIQDVFKPFTSKALKYLKKGNILDAFQVVLGMFEGTQFLPELDSSEYLIFDGAYNSSVQRILEDEIKKIANEVEKLGFSNNQIFTLIDFFIDRNSIFQNELNGKIGVLEKVDNDLIWDLKILNRIFLHFLTNINTGNYFYKKIIENNLEVYSLSNVLLKIAEIKNDSALWIKYSEMFALSDISICRNLLKKFKETQDKENLLKYSELAFHKWKNDFDDFIIYNITPEDNFELYIEGLYSYAMNSKSIKHYEELKKYLNHQVLSEFISLAKEREPKYFINLLSYEKRYNEILDYVKEVNTNYYSNNINEFIIPILNIYPNECYELLETKCKKAMNSDKRNRNTYNSIAEFIRLMLQIEIKNKEALRFLSELYNHKPNLPALKDEFKNAGLLKFL